MKLCEGRDKDVGYELYMAKGPHSAAETQETTVSMLICVTTIKELWLLPCDGPSCGTSLSLSQHPNAERLLL